MPGFLIVDDSAVIRISLRRLLEREGISDASIHEAADGKQAIQEYQRVSPDAVFMDIEMPGIDGGRAAEAIFAADPEARVIIVSAHGRDDERVEKLIASGAYDVIQKPVRRSDVHSIVARLRDEQEGAGRIR